MVDLGWCCKLPKEIKNWTKLRSFEHWRRLTCLEKLRPYMVRRNYKDDDGSDAERANLKDDCAGGIEELEGLNLLRELEIRNLQNVRCGRDAQKANLMGKQNIHILRLNWSSSRRSSSVNEQHSVVLEALQPHPNLKELGIYDFMSVKLPRWMGVSPCLSNLVEMTLIYCRKCVQLPAFGQLPCLRTLFIYGMDDLKCMGKEFYGGGGEGESSSELGDKTTVVASTISFPSLIELSLVSMRNLEEWVGPSYSYSFPCLETLNIMFCPKLRRITPTTLLPSLKKLELRSCPALMSLPDIRRLTSLRELSIRDCGECLKSLPYDLKDLSFINDLDAL